MPRRIWAIADTHLSFANPKPMDIFGAHWHNHAERIRRQCERLISNDDLLMIPGDISWAMKRKDADLDLAFIAGFPGNKVLCKGNHDYWWPSDKRLNFPGLFDTPFKLPNTEVGVAGTRGWIPTNIQMSTEEMLSNETIISREKNRLAKRLTAIGDCTIKLVILHYPPLDDFKDILLEHGVSTLLYGHLHTGGTDHPLPESWHGLRCICVAADRVEFTPKLVMTL
jgi:predicted phosphohydrolase